MARTKLDHDNDDDDWRQFILAHGWRAPIPHLAAVLGRTEREVERVRRTGACTRLDRAMEFHELFLLWHGRPPVDEDWPAPRKLEKRSTYEWLAPEVALLAGLVGQMGCQEIAGVLTARLRTVTGDPAAIRSPQAVQMRINLIGMQSKDVLGGITTADAGREIGSVNIINQAIAKKTLRAVRVGRLWVIPHDVWAEWKQSRILPPDGYVQLSTIREVLGIRSDKLSEFARRGNIPTAIRCNPYGGSIRSTQYGTWFVDSKVAEQLVADRRAGRPMPWHGKPIPENLRATFGLWMSRRHPECCETCRDIWGPQGAPRSFDEYAKRYPPLAFGAKRHLTRVWTPGMTIPEVAAHTGRTVDQVKAAIENGMLKVSHVVGKRRYISRTDATRWLSRKCPSGDADESWISLGTACKQYLFTAAEIREKIRSGKLKSKTGTDGAMRGVVYVSRHQCGQLRERLGFPEEEAARRVGVSVKELRRLLDGANWRPADGIPLTAVQTAIKRKQSREGHSIEEAAQELATTPEWVQARIDDGTIKVMRAKWSNRLYITAPMLRRLGHALAKPPVVSEPCSDAPRLDGGDWLTLGAAAVEAGVCAMTLTRWVQDGELDRHPSRSGWRYRRTDVRNRARLYWQTVRFKRAEPPDWLRAERETHSGGLPRDMGNAPPTAAMPSRSVKPPVDNDVDRAIAILSRKGHVMVRLANGRYLFDGTQSLTEAELIARAGKGRRPARMGVWAHTSAVTASGA